MQTIKINSFLNYYDAQCYYNNVLIVVTEHTCFDVRFSLDHETDVDCGGELCEPCNVTQVHQSQKLL